MNNNKYFKDRKYRTATLVNLKYVAHDKINVILRAENGNLLTKIHVDVDEQLIGKPDALRKALRKEGNKEAYKDMQRVLNSHGYTLEVVKV